MDKIVLKQEKETLLIPLYGKAMESKQPTPILEDQKAIEIVERIAYPFEDLKINRKTNIMMSIRAAILDRFAESFIEKYPDCTCLHLGCGLDSRCLRIPKLGEKWIDVDFPEVIELRKSFYNESETYRMIGSSVTDHQWIETLVLDENKKLVIAEGLFMYLSEDEIVGLIKRLREKIGPFTLIFDAYSTLTASQAMKHPSLKRTGAMIKWGIDEAEDLEKRVTGMQFVEEEYLVQPQYLVNLSMGMRFLFQLSGAFKTAKKAHRIMIYQID